MKVKCVDVHEKHLIFETIADEGQPAFNSPVTTQFKVLANNDAVRSQFTVGATYLVEFTPA